MKAFTLVDFTYEGTEYPKGSEIDLPRNTDQEKADFDKLISYGVITRKAAEADPEAEAPARRSRKD